MFNWKLKQRVNLLEIEIDFLKLRLERLECDHSIEDRVVNCFTTSSRSVEKCIKCKKIIKVYSDINEAKTRQVQIEREILDIQKKCLAQREKELRESNENPN